METALIGAFNKLLSVLTSSESMILLLWVASEKYQAYKQQMIIDRLLKAQQERGESMTRINTMLETLLPRRAAS